MSPLVLERLRRRLETATGLGVPAGERGGALERYAEDLERRLGPAQAEARLASLASGRPGGWDELIDAVTVGLTWFFRDAAQFARIGSLLRGAWPVRQAVRVWVAGCSTGEDAYSVAMLAAEVQRRIVVLATDLSAASLDHARRGVYASAALRELPAGLRERFFTGPPDGSASIESGLRRAVRFERHSLLDAPPRPEPGRAWDLVLCRNVLIYFRPDRARQVLLELAGVVAPGGWLFLGAGEVVCVAPPGLRLVKLGDRVALHRPAEAMGQPSEFIRSRRSASESKAALALLDSGHRFLDQGRTREALLQYEAAVSVEAIRAEAHLFVGLARHLLGEVAGAERSLRRALELRDSLWPAAFYRALCLQTLGRADEARREYALLAERGTKALELESHGRVCHDLQCFADEVLLLARRRAARGDGAPVDDEEVPEEEPHGHGSAALPAR
ncbi:MAG: CheR family methyltransferase [Myxococcales bacterium]